MTYTVLTTSAAKQSIETQVEYLSVERQAPDAAARWLRRVFDAIEGLSRMPYRYPLAEEDAFRPYEIRACRVGRTFLLFRVVEESKCVWLLHTRSTWQRPRLRRLPGGLDGWSG